MPQWHLWRGRRHSMRLRPPPSTVGGCSTAPQKKSSLNMPFSSNKTREGGRAAPLTCKCGTLALLVCSIPTSAASNKCSKTSLITRCISGGRDSIWQTNGSALLYPPLTATTTLP